jgi:hypothetical protein
VAVGKAGGGLGLRGHLLAGCCGIEDRLVVLFGHSKGLGFGDGLAVLVGLELQQKGGDVRVASRPLLGRWLLLAVQRVHHASRRRCLQVLERLPRLLSLLLQLSLGL